MKKFEAIKNLTILPESIKSRDSSRFFSFNVQYPRTYESSIILWPEIKLEFTFIEKILDGYQAKEIEPIVNQFIKIGDTTLLPCLSLLETSADKISALIWRILSHESDDNNMTIMRHLYDLHALLNSDIDKKKLKLHAKLIFEVDKKRGNISENFNTALAMLIEKLAVNKQYLAQYENYVIAMCFGKKERPRFSSAINTLSQFLSS